MPESLLQLCSSVVAGELVARRAILDRDYTVAREAARAILSAGSKLHAQLATIAGLAEEGFSFDLAAVARRAASGKRATPDGEVPGQTTITDALKDRTPVADGVSPEKPAAAPPKRPTGAGKKPKS